MDRSLMSWISHLGMTMQAIEELGGKPMKS